MINFGEVKSLMIPEGEVQNITIGGVPVWEWSKNYTNLVPTAVDLNDAVFNGCGYQDDVYLSSTDWQSVSSDAACVTTGWMPFAYLVGDEMPAIYVKGATIDTSTSHIRGAFYNASKSPAWAWQNSSRDVITVEQLGTDYYKLMLTKTSLNLHYMRFSFIGTGENLVVTVGEPIE